MNIAIISFTRRGAGVADALSQGLGALGHSATAYAMPRHAGQSLLPLTEPLAAWAARQFSISAAIVFIGACGVAVRAVAPHLKGKAEDPAVVVLDDNARFAISLLSGHIGGANALTQAVAHITGAQAVISTATDGAGLFAVDAWAAQNGCALWELAEAKAVSAALLDGEPVGLVCDFPIEGALPAGVTLGAGGVLGIYISLDETAAPFQKTLHIVPRIVTLGIGCKRSTPREAIAQQACAALAEHRISPRAVAATASISLKAEEPGLLAFCKTLGTVLTTYSAEELSCAEGEFTPSAFVRGVTGVDNVCERSAVLSAGPGGTLLMKKQAGGGVTAAAAVRDWRVRFG